MRMNLARRLSEAVGSWMHFEFCCHRGGLMSEAALKGAVGQVLSAFPTTNAGARVHAEIHHDALKTGKAGRKRCVDFALALVPDVGPVIAVEIAVETKWAGSSHCTSINIAEDFVRLALIKRSNPDARCIFILAGTASEVAKVLKAAPFVDGRVKNAGIHIGVSPRSLIFDPLKPSHRKIFQESFRDWQTKTKVPKSIVTCAHGCYPEQNSQATVRFQSIAWELTSVSSENIGFGW